MEKIILVANFSEQIFRNLFLTIKGKLKWVEAIKELSAAKSARDRSATNVRVKPKLKLW